MINASAAAARCRLVRPLKQSRRIMSTSASSSSARSRRTPATGQVRQHYMESGVQSESSGSRIPEVAMLPGALARMKGQLEEPASAHLTPAAQYELLVKAGSRRGDDHQREVVGSLQALHDQLVNYDRTTAAARVTAPPSGGPSLLSRWFSTAPTTSTTPSYDHLPRGLYLYGDVGTGKSMLMDLFYDTLPPRIKKKRRVHFHAFMIDVHKRMHAAKQAFGHAGGDPVLPVAKELAQEADVICFDEFQVTDIAVAMILRRLLESMLDSGVVFVMTSNRHPDKLYKNGIQRASFIPCIEMLKERFDVINLDSGTDYRRIPRALSNVYYDPLTKENTSEIDKIFNALAAMDGEEIKHGHRIHIWGRELRVPESTSTVAKFTFEELCGRPLSAADYLEVTKTFRTVFLTDVPKMNLDSKDKARRFITFIDACYESKTKLFVTSEVPIYKVFSDDSAGKAISDHQRSVMDDLGLSESVMGTSSMFNGEEEIFAFARCCSRLVQMGSKEWAETAGQE